METKKKWYQGNAAIIAFLVLFFPVGLYLMWKHANWNKTVKWIVTGVFAFIILVNAIGGSNPSSTTSTTQNSAPTANPVTEVTTQPEMTTEQEQAVEPTKAPVKAANTPAPQTQQAAPAQGASVSQQNAVRKAKSYISYSGFSRDGLVAQLEFEKFSHEDAVYGADNSGGNWNEEAAQKAKSYMDMMGYSRDGLIQQLLFEKFNQVQAEYGANSVGL